MEYNNPRLVPAGSAPARTKTRTILSGTDYLLRPPEALNTGKYLIKGENGQSFWLTDELLAMGLLILGSTGCGKTTVIFQLLDQIIPRMTRDDVMIIFDSKGDFINRYYDPRNPFHVLVSLEEQDASRTAVWNIFREMKDGKGYSSSDAVDINASEIATALFKGFESESQPFFNLAAADITAKLLATFVKDALQTKDPSHLSNLAFSEFLSRADNKDILALTGKYPGYRYLRSYVGEGSSNQALGVYGYLQAAKSRTFVSSFNKADPSRDFGIRELVRNKGGKIMFIKLSIQYAETAGVVDSLLFDLGAKEALICPSGNKWFICDEGRNLPYLQRLDQLLNYGRSFGCKTIFGLQSFAQLKENYGEDKANAIAAGFCNLFAYQNTDYESRNYVKQRCGEVFEAYSYGGQNVSHDSFTVRDSDLRNLSTGQAFIDLKNVPPFLFHFRDCSNH